MQIGTKKQSFTKLSMWKCLDCVTSISVDLFNKDFNGMREKLDYLQNLGVDCIWLLPIFDSPMKDGGFDVRDYYTYYLLKALTA